MPGPGRALAAASSSDGDRPPSRLVAETLIDYLSGRPASEGLLYRYQSFLDNSPTLAFPTYRNARCEVCSRLLRYPENARIHA